MEPAVCLSDPEACEEQINSFTRQKPKNIILLATFLIFMNQNIQFMIFTLVNDHFIIWPSSVTMTFNLSQQMFQRNNYAKLV